MSAALLINAGIEIAFAYRENQAMLSRLQSEKADAAAQRITNSSERLSARSGGPRRVNGRPEAWTNVASIMCGFCARCPRSPNSGSLMRAAGSSSRCPGWPWTWWQAGRTSRVTHCSATPWSTRYRSVRCIWNESEPYLTIAIAGSGRNPGVTVADVNLKLIWDVIRGLQIGRNGYAYVVDRQGRLIAHPDTSLVLRNTSFAMLPQVAAGLREMDGGTSTASQRLEHEQFGAEKQRDAHAECACHTASAWLAGVRGVPRAEALEPLYESAMRTTVVLLAGLVLATLVALFMVRRMVGPIRLLQAGTARIGSGDLDSRIDVKTGDELESLADQFNTMAAQLRQSYSGLERKVAERTEELHESLKYQTAISDVLRVMSQSITDIAPALQTVVEMAVRLCHASQASIFELENGVYRWKVGHGLNAAYRKIEADTDIRWDQARWLDGSQ